MPEDAEQLPRLDADLGQVGNLPDVGPTSRFEAVLLRFAQLEMPLGLALVAAGFLAIWLGWLEASGTADVRIQMQALVSGGVGGLAMVMLGGFLLIAQLAERSARRSEEKLDRLVAALVAARASTGDTSVDESPDLVMGSDASYHRLRCDLTAGRQLTRMTSAEAVDRGLEPCPVCRP